MNAPPIHTTAANTPTAIATGVISKPVEVEGGTGDALEVDEKDREGEREAPKDKLGVGDEVGGTYPTGTSRREQTVPCNTNPGAQSAHATPPYPVDDQHTHRATPDTPDTHTPLPLQYCPFADGHTATG